MHIQKLLTRQNISITYSLLFMDFCAIYNIE